MGPVWGAGEGDALDLSTGVTIECPCRDSGKHVQNPYSAVRTNDEGPDLPLSSPSLFEGGFSDVVSGDSRPFWGLSRVDSGLAGSPSGH